MVYGIPHLERCWQRIQQGCRNLDEGLGWHSANPPLTDYPEPQGDSDTLFCDRLSMLDFFMMLTRELLMRRGATFARNETHWYMPPFVPRAGAADFSPYALGDWPRDPASNSRACVLTHEVALPFLAAQLQVVGMNADHPDYHLMALLLFVVSGYRVRRRHTGTTLGFQYLRPTDEAWFGQEDLDVYRNRYVECFENHGLPGRILNGAVDHGTVVIRRTFSMSRSYCFPLTTIYDVYHREYVRRRGLLWVASLPRILRNGWLLPEVLYVVQGLLEGRDQSAWSAARDFTPWQLPSSYDPWDDDQGFVNIAGEVASLPSPAEGDPDWEDDQFYPDHDGDDHGHPCAEFDHPPLVDPVVAGPGGSGAAGSGSGQSNIPVGAASPGQGGAVGGTAGPSAGGAGASTFIGTVPSQGGASLPVTAVGPSATPAVHLPAAAFADAAVAVPVDAPADVVNVVPQPMPAATTSAHVLSAAQSPAVQLQPASVPAGVVLAGGGGMMHTPSDQLPRTVSTASADAGQASTSGGGKGYKLKPPEKWEPAKMQWARWVNLYKNWMYAAGKDTDPFVFLAQLQVSVPQYLEDVVAAFITGIRDGQTKPSMQHVNTLLLTLESYQPKYKDLSSAVTAWKEIRRRDRQLLEEYRALFLSAKSAVDKIDPKHISSTAAMYHWRDTIGCTAPDRRPDGTEYHNLPDEQQLPALLADTLSRYTTVHHKQAPPAVFDAKETTSGNLDPHRRPQKKRKHFHPPVGTSSTPATPTTPTMAATTMQPAMSPSTTSNPPEVDLNYMGGRQGRYGGYGGGYGGQGGGGGQGGYGGGHGGGGYRNRQGGYGNGGRGWYHQGNQGYRQGDDRYQQYDRDRAEGQRGGKPQGGKGKGKGKRVHFPSQKGK
jgi:hypothetical protein